MMMRLEAVKMLIETFWPGNGDDDEGKQNRKRHSNFHFLKDEKGEKILPELLFALLFVLRRIEVTCCLG